MKIKLKNGARVLHYFTKQNETIVMAEWDRGVASEFVTWAVDDDLNAYAGHYFTTYRAALKDLLERAAIRKMIL